jgi:putative addiction module CopG family antidote
LERCAACASEVGDLSFVFTGSNDQRVRADLKAALARKESKSVDQIACSLLGMRDWIREKRDPEAAKRESDVEIARGEPPEAPAGQGSPLAPREEIISRSEMSTMTVETKQSARSQATPAESPPEAASSAPEAAPPSRHLQISLPSGLERLVMEKVESGLYGGASDVVQEALRLMAHRDSLQQHRLRRLRHAGRVRA